MNAPLRPKTLRAEEWAASKAGVLFGFADLTLLAVLADPVWSTGRTLASFALFAVALVGLAGVGYVLNDLADESADRQAGIVRPVVDLHRSEQALLIGVLLVMAIAPWAALDTSPSTFALLALELLLLLAYSLWPFRLKERGALALLTDAAYGYVVPIALTVATFSKAGHDMPTSVVGTALVWGTAIGIRSIAQHQQTDLENDTAAGTTTWATVRDPEAVESWVSRMWIVEILAFVVLIGRTSTISVAIPVGLGIGLLWELAQVTSRRALGESTQLPGDVVDRLVTCWFPMTVAAALVARHPGLWPIAAAQVVVAWRWLADLPTGGVHRTRVAVSYTCARLGRQSVDNANRHAAAVARSPTHIDVARRAIRAIRRRLRP